MYAVDSYSGLLKWKFQTNDWITSSPNILDGLVYLISNDGYLYAVDSESKELKWEFDIGGDPFTSPVIADGLLFIGSENGLYSVYL